MRKLQRILRNYFGFSQVEAKGFWVWTFIMVFLLGLNLLVGYLPLPTHTVHEREKQAFEKVLATLKSTHTEGGFEKATDITSQPLALEGERFMFNPNNASEEILKRLGIPTRFITSILKFTAKGGKFRQKDDLKKIYNFPENLYLSLEPYIDLPAQRQAKGREEREIRKFDLNTADTATISQVRGIGAKTAQSIVKYRELLGGFTNAKQLYEVYLLKDRPEVVAALTQYIEIDLAKVKKINVNRASLEAMQAHPYLRDVAKYIVKVRQTAGKPFTIDEFIKLKPITPEKWEKLKPYLDFE